jgi:hypothetical protein
MVNGADIFLDLVSQLFHSDAVTQTCVGERLGYRVEQVPEKISSLLIDHLVVGCGDVRRYGQARREVRRQQYGLKHVSRAKKER